MKIWVLFSEANEYYQPDHNLEAWWYEKPTKEILAECIEINLEIYRKQVDYLLEGITIRIGESEYRLVEISEGKLV